jgi:hypothetical protein
MVVTRREVGAASHNALVIDSLEEVESIKLVIKKMAKR